MASTDELVLNLRPNRDLIDPFFDRYILMNERFIMKKMNLTHKVHYQTPSSEQFGYQHVKTFSIIDRLVFDQFSITSNTLTSYVVLENGGILSARFQKTELTWLEPVEVAHIQCLQSSRTENSYPPTLLFIDETFAVVSDGCGFVEFYLTGDRSLPTKWQLVNQLEKELVPPSIIIDVRKHAVEESNTLNVELLLQSVKSTKNEELDKTVFSTHFVWLTVARSEGGFNVVRKREIECEGHVEFATLNPAGNDFFVVSNSRPTFVSDSLKPLNKMEVEIDIEKQELISQKETKREEDSELNSEVNPSAVQGKSEDALSTEDTSPLFNSEQLEECDIMNDILCGSYVSGETHKLIKIVDLAGSQILFTIRFFAGGSLNFASRSDVDGIVWSLDKSNDVAKYISHKLTLHAFGFIQAGHNEKQFTTCSPDGNYAVIINRKNHVFIYFQNASIDKQCELKNRKTGAVKSTVAKQVVFALSQADSDYNLNEPDGEYIGYYAANDLLFLLTHNAIIAIQIKQNDE